MKHIKIDRIILGLTLILVLLLTWSHRDQRKTIHTINQVLEWVVEVQRGQIEALKATRDSLVANDIRVLQMLQFHSRYHEEQEKRFLPEGG